MVTNTLKNDELRQKVKELGVALLLAVQRDFDGTDEYVDFFVRDSITLINSQALKLIDRLEKQAVNKFEGFGQAPSRYVSLSAIQEERKRYE